MAYSHYQTGDILLFHKSGCLQCLIDCCTESKYSHAAIVLRDPQFTNPPLKGLYVWESTGLEPVRDVEDGLIKFGVQIREFSEVLRDYDGEVYVRHLDVERDEAFYQRLAHAHNVAHNRFYDVLPQDWLGALFNRHLGNVHRKRTFFCSALVAFVYTSLGLLPADTAWSIVRPKDLGTERGHRLLHFENCYVHQEVCVN